MYSLSLWERVAEGRVRELFCCHRGRLLLFRFLYKQLNFVAALRELTVYYPAGSVTVNVVPPPLLLVTKISPPMASTRFFVTNSPNPVPSPGFFVVK